MDTSPKKVVITGGAGFIGSHIVRVLHNRGISVTVFDSLVSGSKENLPEGVSLIVDDIRNPEALANAFKDATHVVHLAALISVPESVKNPQATHDVNIIGTKNVLDAAAQAGVQRFVYASSAAVYGNDPALPKKEDMQTSPTSPYAESKVQNEIDASHFSATTGIPSVGLRFFNIYGPGQLGNHAYASVIPRWIEAVENGEQIQVFGDGEQTRDFVHVEDVAAALHTALVTPIEGAHIYNVASGKQITLRELRDHIATTCNCSIDWIQYPEREGDIRHSVADVHAIEDELNFEPKIDLQEGLKTLIS
ncbi:MAG: dTDP-glucose 4,6-dehydratase [Parcubacteria bacterium C7867-007]|nr:MAG: dTDP-glucose 4,6-dehydratase [Parcubacteria bacterium C7867-007]